MKNKYFLMYSVSQKSTVVDTFDSMLRSNWSCAARQQDSGYMVMGIFDTYDEAHKAGLDLLEQLRPI